MPQFWMTFQAIALSLTLAPVSCWNITILLFSVSCDLLRYVSLMEHMDFPFGDGNKRRWLRRLCYYFGGINQAGQPQASWSLNTNDSPEPSDSMTMLAPPNPPK